MKFATTSLATALASALLLSACATKPPEVKVEAPAPIKLSTLGKDEQVAEEKRQRAIETRKAVIVNLPEWFLSPPKSDEGTLYSVGTDSSDRLGTALEKAMLAAKLQLADQINGKISSNTRQILRDGDGKSKSVTQYDRATTNTILQTAVKHYVVQEKSVHVTDKGYTAFILLKYDIEDGTDKGTSIENFTAMKELDQKVKSNAETKSQPVSSIEPESKVSTVQLLDVDNIEYKQRRDAALQKPGAVVGQVTVR